MTRALLIEGSRVRLRDTRAYRADVTVRDRCGLRRTCQGGAMPETHSRTVPGGRGHHLTKHLWELAAGLPVTWIPIESIAEFDRDCWFRGRGPTIREVAEHVRRVQSADLSHPVILNADGGLMDGGHRLVKAWLMGETEIPSVRFVQTPAPDYVEVGPAPAEA
jgi:hypothetical protein